MGMRTVIGRRALITATLIGGAALATPAFACRAPIPKDRNGYTKSVDKLFAAWWARDYGAFQRPFQDPEVKDPFEGRAIFDAHFVERQGRFRGQLLFNGASVIVQILSPQGTDYVHGICGGYAQADLFLVSFFPGLTTPVMEKVEHVGFDLLAAGEWETMRDPHRS
jgi:hypothetical protein